MRAVIAAPAQLLEQTRFRHAVERAGSGSGQPARCRAADCGCVPGVIVARALSATGEAITLVGFAEAAGGGKGGEALVEGGGSDAAARAQLGEWQRAVDVG